MPPNDLPTNATTPHSKQCCHIIYQPMLPHPIATTIYISYNKQYYHTIYQLNYPIIYEQSYHNINQSMLQHHKDYHIVDQNKLAPHNPMNFTTS